MYTLEKQIDCEISIKKSRFICGLYPVNTIEEANNIINQIKLKNPKANHHVSAYRIGTNSKFDDDGEPKGTAGKPIFNVLEKNNLTNIVCIVTRYFGGIKLGASGLTRAYTKAITSAITNQSFCELHCGHLIKISIKINDQKKIEHILRKHNIVIIEKSYDYRAIFFCDILEVEQEKIFEEILQFNQLTTIEKIEKKLLSIKIK